MAVTPLSHLRIKRIISIRQLADADQDTRDAFVDRVPREQTNLILVTRGLYVKDFKNLNCERFNRKRNKRVKK